MANSQLLFDRVNQLSLAAGLPPLPPSSFGATPEKFIGGYGQSLANMFSNEYRAWRVGLNINLSFRNRTAKAQLGRALVEGRRVDAERERTEQLIEVEVRNALQAVETAKRRAEAAKNSASMPNCNSPANSTASRRDCQPVISCWIARTLCPQRVVVN